MATEPAADSEQSVALSSPLSEWLDERAAALGVDRNWLLVELLETYREMAELDPEEVDALQSAAATSKDDVRTVEREEFDDLERRIEEIDAALSEHVEDLRGRILQLKEAVESSAPADHEHPEIGTLSRRIETIASTLEDLEAESEATATELEELGSDLESNEDRLGTVETRLHRLARVVLELKQRAEGTADSAEALDSIRRTANRNGTTAADCENCGERLRIGLLTEAACPHCEQTFRDIEYPSSILGRFRSPQLTGTDPATTEAEPESEPKREREPEPKPESESEPESYHE
ncbi:hypothetical protein KM295_06690 [Natronomonas sp. F2-12]|uniref:CopG family transcriptional regulator n=1 Tax=Natronomonas aquatica TaxID=2841590 RepID=A0A9R1CSM1_9EURY|nr:hypothetical protein [Natronomonas aquatica]MCQ4333170.1 hypothetical protein [Natronomonas aquatica]